ncbi:hypothetical protein LSCM1_01990 [Leishmania martiniquensis]|uniref:Uncharacterized protein n=1 Tax=Leishmania martiniquensis TaxID=1580590 RepID=A0A836H4I0_9TRYP|nr:hypothetical protein LSCM1_01990 [Leishmania martiniquensis]
MNELISTVSAMPVGTYALMADFKRNSGFDMVESADTQTQGKSDAANTHVTSAEDSRSSSTARIDSLEIATAPGTPRSSLKAVPQQASVQEALEDCMESVLIAASEYERSDEMTEEILPLMDKEGTVHLPALADLFCLEHLFAGYTCSERVNAVLMATRTSSKLVLRDDLPVPSSHGCLLSEAEAEAAKLRVGLRSSADGDAPTLKCQQHASAGEPSVCLRAPCQLQVTTAPQKLQEVQLSSCSPCLLPAAFPSPVASDSADALCQAKLPPTDARASRQDDAHGPSRALPVAPAPPAPVAEGPGSFAVPAQRIALMRPRAIASDLFPPEYRDCAADRQATVGVPAQQACVPMPKPPLAIDIVMMVTADRVDGATLSSIAKEVTSASAASLVSLIPVAPTISATANMTTASMPDFNLSATSFPAETVSSTADIIPIVSHWRPTSYAPRHLQLALSGAPTTGCIDASEGMTNDLLNMTWACGTRSLCAGSSCGENYGAVGARQKGSPITPPVPLGEHLQTLSSKEEVLPGAGAPKDLTADKPQTAFAIDFSERADALPTTGPGRSHPLMACTAKESFSSSSFDGSRSIRTPALRFQPSPCLSSQSRRHRHDPYGQTGFALCSENCSAFSSLTNMPSRVFAFSVSSNLSYTAQKVCSFRFEDPLIKASAQVRERRLVLGADTNGATSPERESVSLSIANLDTASASSDNAAEVSYGPLPCDQLVDTATAAPTAAGPMTFIRSIDEDPPAATVAPKSFVEALLLNLKRTRPPVHDIAKPAHGIQ